MRFLVTGGAGFIGSHLVDLLVAEGGAVTVLDSLEPQVHPHRPDDLNPGARYVWGDVLDRAALDPLVKESDAVIHLAAAVGVGQSMYEVARYTRANALGTATLLDALVNTEHPVRKLVVAGSMSSYGEGRYACRDCGPVDPPLRGEEALRQRRWEPRCPSCQGALRPAPTPEDKAPHGPSVYALGKKHQEELCLSVGRAYGLPTVSLRFFNVYGPRQQLSNPYTGVAAIFSARAKNGNPPVVFEDGLQTRDFVYVGDVARALRAAATRGGGDGQALNVGSGAPQSILGIAETLIGLYGAAVKPEVTHRYRAGDIRHCYADTRRIREALGWTAETPFEEGMRRLAAWGDRQQARDGFDRAHAELVQRGLVER